MFGTNLQSPVEGTKLQETRLKTLRYTKCKKSNTSAFLQNADYVSVILDYRW